MAAMSDPDRNPQHRRGHNWFPEEAKKPPPETDARQRRPEVQQGAAPIANTKPEEKLNIAPRCDSRTTDELAGAKKHIPSGRLKTGPRHKRRQPNFERVTKIARRFLDPRGRP